MISVTILTKNSSQHLARVLTALSSFEEILIYDTGSTDQTLTIAAHFPNVRIHSGSFQGFGATHNQASSLAHHDWILSIDSDEVVTPELVDEIRNRNLSPDCVYSVARHNFYNERWVRCCGWYPDRQVKLYHRHRTRFSEAQVHEAVETNGFKIVKLLAPILHYPYASTADFLNKMQLYSDLFAKQHAGKRQSSTGKAILHGLLTFFKSYFLKRGFMGGREGFLISVYNANTAFYKYLKLAEQQNR